MEWWSAVAAMISRLLDEHGLPTAFVLLFLEEAGVPPLLPGDVLMILIGIRAAAGKVGLLEALAILQAATLLGGSILYWVSAWGGQALFYRIGRYVGATPARLDRAHAALERHGVVAIVLGRLLPGLSMMTTVACGILKLPYRRFLPALALGGLLRNVLFVLLGYVFGPPILAFVERLHLPLELVASAVFLLGLGLWTYRMARASPPDPPRPASIRERVRCGALAGLLGAVLSTLLANVLIEFAGLLSYHEPGKAIVASGLLGKESAPVLMLLVAPAFVVLPTLWGAVYGAWAAGTLPGRSWQRGVAFSLLPLAVSLLVILPLAGAGPLGLGLGAGPIPALGEAARYLAYGVTLGVAFSALARRRGPSDAMDRLPHPA